MYGNGSDVAITPSSAASSKENLTRQMSDMSAGSPIPKDEDKRGRFTTEERKVLVSLIWDDVDILSAFCHQNRKHNIGHKSFMHLITDKFNELAEIKRSHEAVRHHLKLRRNGASGGSGAKATKAERDFFVLEKLLEHRCICTSKDSCTRCLQMHRLRVQQGLAKCNKSDCHRCTKSLPDVKLPFNAQVLLEDIRQKRFPEPFRTPSNTGIAPALISSERFSAKANPASRSGSGEAPTPARKKRKASSVQPASTAKGNGKVKKSTIESKELGACGRIPQALDFSYASPENYTGLYSGASLLIPSPTNQFQLQDQGGPQSMVFPPMSINVNGHSAYHSQPATRGGTSPCYASGDDAGSSNSSVATCVPPTGGIPLNSNRILNDMCGLHGVKTEDSIHPGYLS